jgi:Baseplate J-like protein.
VAQFEDQTFEAIIERMLARLPDDIDKRQGSVVHDLLAPAAAELAQAYIEMDNVLNLGFADTTYGEYLDRRAAEQGLTRKPAVKSTGRLTFSGPEGTVIPIGTRVSTEGETPVYFVTTTEGTIAGGTVTVDAEAEVGGVNGNVGAGKITVVLGDLSGVVTVTNTEPFTGGIDEETDEELYERYKEKVTRPITSGNKYQYEAWAKEIAGVADARCYPRWNGNGTVKVVVVDSEKRSPSAQVIQAVADYIEEVRPVLADVTVVGVTEVPINISVTVTLSAGANPSDVEAGIRENITEYFKKIGFVETVVRYTAIGNAILDANGVIDYSNLTVNGAVSNVIFNDDEVPILGAVSITFQ